jgi:hypothetical protein
MADALTDLAAYALELDTEYCRLDKRVGELTRQECSSADLWAVLSERAELAEELEEFRGAIASFREQLLPQYATGADHGVNAVWLGDPIDRRALRTA